MSELDSALRGISQQLSAMGSELSQQMLDIDASVGKVRHDLASTQGELAAFKEEFLEFVKQAARVANVQQAETKVGNLKAELDRQFGHYSAVRRTSIGMLQAFDIGNVTNATVQTVSEELMIQSPRYWLAPTIVALAAWSRDDKELAEKSVEVAFSRDRLKTSLFFALVMRRQGRIDTAVRWLKHYLNAIDPTSLTREFAVILEASSYNAFGTHGQQLVQSKVAAWVEQLRDDDDLVEEQVRRWVRELGVRRMQLSLKPYETLAAISPDWPAVHRQLESASALAPTAEHYGAIRDRDAHIPSGIVDLLDDVLEKLVTEYDAEELPLKRDVVYQEAIITENGDLTRAQNRADAEVEALEDFTDVLSIQTQGALTPDKLGISEQTQRILIGVSVDEFRTATGRFCAAYRQHALDDVALNFDEKHSNYAKTYRFKGCSLRASTPEDQGVAALHETWNRTFEEYIESLRFDNKWYITPSVIALGVVLLVFVVSGQSAIATLLTFAVGAGVVWFLGNQKAEESKKAIADVEKMRHAAVETSVSVYRDATAQFTDALLVYEECDDHEADLLKLIDGWPTAVHHEKENV